MPEPPNAQTGRRLTINLGDIEVGLLTVNRLEDHVDAHRLLRDPDAPEPPYWMHLWPGAVALARAVAQAEAMAGRRVVEIGAGLGLPAIAAARRGARATIVDCSREALCFAGAAAALNGCEIDLVCGDILFPALRGAFDLCLAADVAYSPALQTGVASFLAAHLAAGGVAWCADSVRVFDQGLRLECRARGLRVTERELRERDGAHMVPVRVTEVRRE